MNLSNWIQDLFAVRRAGRACSGKRFFGQNAPARLKFKTFMLLFAHRAVFCFCWGLFLIVPAAVFGQTNYYSANGTEYAVIGSLPGDQVFPDAAVTTTGGFVVWQDNITDGSGEGISARRLDGTLSGTLGTFRVNVQGTNDQENPRVALLKNGGAVFVWQGGVESYQHIFARFLTPTNTFLTTTDVAVSTFNSSSSFQVNPAVTVLNNSNVVVVWSSFDQAGSSSLHDVYGQILSPSGAENRHQIFDQSIYFLQPADASGGGLEERRVCRVMGFRAGTAGCTQSGIQYKFHRRQRRDKPERGRLCAALRQQRGRPRQ